jgi:hypothetical protein
MNVVGDLDARWAYPVKLVLNALCHDLFSFRSLGVEVENKQAP